MIFNNSYLNSLIQEELGTDSTSFSMEELANVKYLNIEQNIDFEELVKLTNLEELKFYNLEITVIDLALLNNLKELKNLYFIDCEIESFRILNGMKLDTLYIDNSTVDELKYLNNLFIDKLFLHNMVNVDLDDLSIIRNVTSLSLDYSKVLNEKRMIFLDKIENLSLVKTGIESIDTLIANESLKYLIIDEKIAKNNQEVIKELQKNDVNVEIV